MTDGNWFLRVINCQVFKWIWWVDRALTLVGLDDLQKPTTTCLHFMSCIRDFFCCWRNTKTTLVTAVRHSCCRRTMESPASVVPVLDYNGYYGKAMTHFRIEHQTWAALAQLRTIYVPFGLKLWNVFNFMWHGINCRRPISGIPSEGEI